MLSTSHIPLINSSCFHSSQRCFWLFNTFICLLSMKVSQSLCYGQQASWLHLAAWLPAGACSASWHFQRLKNIFSINGYVICWEQSSSMACETVSEVPYTQVWFLDSIVMLLCFYPPLSSLGAPSLQLGKRSLP